MSKTINMSISTKSADRALRELKEYQKSFEKRVKELVKRLAMMGATKVSLGFSRAQYDGQHAYNSVSVEVEEIPLYQGYKAVINASGGEVLFIEFGTGVNGGGHPQAADFHMGPGTYPGKGHWNDPNGWWYSILDDTGTERIGSRHTYGNPPSMTMYKTGKELRQEIERVAKEVFST